MVGVQDVFTDSIQRFLERTFPHQFDSSSLRRCIVAEIKFARTIEKYCRTEIE